MSYKEVLGKRIDILCLKQSKKESAKEFYRRLRVLRNEHRTLLKQAREIYSELFESSQATEETAIIGYILGIKFDIRRYLHAPCEYRTLKEAALHAIKIEHRLKQLQLPIIAELEENKFEERESQN